MTMMMVKAMNKQWVVRLGALSIAGFMASGCMMYTLEELRRTSPSGTRFQTKLSRMYLRFAEQEEGAYDWQDSWHFADKGLMLAYGNDVEPELLENWRLDSDSLVELEKARIRVMEALTPQLKDGNPDQAAAIQFYFDCWVEQQEENWQTDDIAQCRNGLMRALDGHVSLHTMPKQIAKMSEPSTKKTHEIRHVEQKPILNAKGKRVPALGDSPFGGPTPAPTKLVKQPAVSENMVAATVDDAKKVVQKPMKLKEAVTSKVPNAEKKSVETASYAVFFEQKKPEISTPGKNVLAEVTQMLKDSLDYSVILHVAKQPSADVSPELSRERLGVVRATLEDGGVRSDAIYDDSQAANAKSASKRIELFLNE